MIYCISVPEDCFYLNSVDPDEMLHTVAGHLILHCLPKYCFPIEWFLVYKGLTCLVSEVEIIGDGYIYPSNFFGPASLLL